jgi:hypothetical protein
MMIQEASLADNHRAQFARVIQGDSVKDRIKVLQARMAGEGNP